MIYKYNIYTTGKPRQLPPKNTKPVRAATVPNGYPMMQDRGQTNSQSCDGAAALPYQNTHNTQKTRQRQTKGWKKEKNTKSKERNTRRKDRTERWKGYRCLSEPNISIRCHMENLYQISPWFTVHQEPEKIYGEREIIQIKTPLPPPYVQNISKLHHPSSPGYSIKRCIHGPISM